jgi:hypothetical protein
VAAFTAIMAAFVSGAYERSTGTAVRSATAALGCMVIVAIGFAPLIRRRAASGNVGALTIVFAIVPLATFVVAQLVVAEVVGPLIGPPLVLVTGCLIGLFGGAVSTPVLIGHDAIAERHRRFSEVRVQVGGLPLSRVGVLFVAAALVAGASLSEPGSMHDLRAAQRVARIDEDIPAWHLVGSGAILGRSLDAHTCGTQADLFPAHTAGAGTRFEDPAEDAPGMVSGALEVSVYVSRTAEDAINEFVSANGETYEACSAQEAKGIATMYEPTATGAPEIIHPLRRPSRVAKAIIDEYEFIFPTTSGRAATWVARISIVHERALLRVLVVDFLGRSDPQQLDTLVSALDRRAEASFG